MSEVYIQKHTYILPRLIDNFIRKIYCFFVCLFLFTGNVETSSSIKTITSSLETSSAVSIDNHASSYVPR